MYLNRRVFVMYRLLVKLWTPVCFTAPQAPSEKGTILKVNDVLPQNNINRVDSSENVSRPTKD